jgi:hypothetical protein
MLNKLIIYSFILFLFIIIIMHFFIGGNILEGLDSASPPPLALTPEYSPLEIKCPNAP